MVEVFKDYVKGFVGKVNLYILLQIAWLVEYYVLAIFAGKNFLEEELQVIVKQPEVISRYSDKILECMKEYNQYLLLLALVILFVGFSGSCFIHIRALGKYKLIYKYSDFGLYAGCWMLLIYFTYSIYEVLDSLFLFAPFFALFICEAIKKIRDWLETKGIKIGD